MYSVSMYREVRLAVTRGGMSKRKAAETFELDPRTVRKMMENPEPPGYQRSKPVRLPKLGPFTGFIDQILKNDLEKIKKERHTAQRIYERLRDEYGYDGKYGAVKEYVRGKRLHLKEKFVPLSHAPGHAQVDFGQTHGVIGGVERKIHFFCMSLPYSDDSFVMGFPAETTEAFCAGHNAACDHFGGVPQSILYDNTSIAVVKVYRDGRRDLTEEMIRLQSHYLFDSRFGRPARGNDKGKVEGLVGYARRNFMVPAPRFESFDALNAHLRQKCLERRQQTLRGCQRSIGERFSTDQAAFLPLPPIPYDACEKVSAKVTSQALVRYRTNDYSVPVRYGFHDVQVRGYIHEVVIACGAEVIARHPRSYAREDAIYDPLHYLALLEEKPRALDQAAPLQGWELPDEFATLRRLMESRLGKKGKREYIQVLRLLETFSFEQVHFAVQQALKLGAIGFEAVKHLLIRHIEQRPLRLDLSRYPFLPEVHVARTSARDYAALTSGEQR
ncbi:IS21 family transposase [Magnetofaba australis]|uniref:IS21 family transposase n=1 Tax=Magnetofaba australis TaxID=1472297 RepID=UPI00117D95BB|nr:IS21 family transposase [Magnetofaba australis]